MTTVTAREYLRVSQDSSGRERSPEEQHHDHQVDAEREGWVLLDSTPYRDLGSASRYARKGREGYDRLIADLDAGTFGASVLMLWEASRGARRMGEWVLLLDLLAEQRVKLWIHTHARTYTLSNARDRRTLLEDGTDSEYESAKTSARIRRARAAEAEAGLPQGRAPFGYRPVYDQDKRGRAIGWEIVPEEAAIIRELYDRVRQGHALRAIAFDFAARGITSPRRTTPGSGRQWGGKQMSGAWLSQLATNPAYTGLRRHRNGDGEEHLYDSDEKRWPRIVDRATWQAVQNILRAPDRPTRRPGKGRHFLSMIARCDVCGGPLTSKKQVKGRLLYSCRDRGCVGVPQHDLDGYVTEVILAYLSDPENAARLTADTGDGPEVAAARDAVAAIEAELDELADQVGRGELSATLAARAEPAILGRLESARQRVTALETPSVLSGLLGPADQVTTRWADMPMAAKREAARLLLSPGPGRLGQVRVIRSPAPRQGCPVEQRVIWHRES